MNCATPVKRDDPAPSLWETLPVYFRQAASPIRRFLQDSDFIEICVNRPGEVWIEALGRPAMEGSKSRR